MMYILLVCLLFSGCFGSFSDNKPNNNVQANSQSTYYLQDSMVKGQPVRMILKDNKPLTRQEFIKAISDQSLQKIINQDIYLQKQAVFFETTELSQKTKNQIFYYALLPAKLLNNVSADTSSFADNIVMKTATEQNKTITTFANLSGSSTLIVPTLIKSHLDNKENYLSLYHFLCNAPQQEIQTFWELWASEAQQRLSQSQTTWMSTHGTGVYWLHGRLDNTPKYYSSILKNIS